MTDQAAVPPWLATMRSFIGTTASASSVQIVGWAYETGVIFPDTAAYCAGFRDARTAWCGESLGYCMAVSGIRPPFGATDVERFFYAKSWAGDWGADASSDPHVGDVAVFQWRSGSDAGGHHVTLISGIDIQNRRFLCCGGNQHHAVNETWFPMDEAIAVRRPPAPSVAVVAAKPARVTTERFDVCLPYTLAQECPHPEDWSNPKNFSVDPNPTMCGIEQGEYDVWRKTKMLPVQDVRKLSRQEGADIYLHSYWLPRSQLMGLGLDMAFFDASVNEGAFEAIKMLQHVLGVPGDGDWGQESEAALVAADLMDTIEALTSYRKAVYRQMLNFPKYGADWLRRADEIGATAVKMAAAAYPVTGM